MKHKILRQKEGMNRQVYALLLLTIGLGLIGCYLGIPTTPAMDTATLLLEVTDLPSGWTVRESGRYRNNPNLTEGAEEVVFVSFRFADPEASSGESIYRYHSDGRAAWEYGHGTFSYWPGEDWWQVPQELQQIDITANQWRVGCTDRWFSNEMFCSFVAQYGEYLVHFSATIAVDGQEVMTVAEFASILEKIDQKMVNREIPRDPNDSDPGQ